MPALSQHTMAQHSASIDLHLSCIQTNTAAIFCTNITCSAARKLPQRRCCKYTMYKSGCIASKSDWMPDNALADKGT